MLDQRGLHIAPKTSGDPAAAEPVWMQIMVETRSAVVAEPHLADFFKESVLRHTSFEKALGNLLALRLSSQTVSTRVLGDILASVYDEQPGIGALARADLCAVCERDPATHRYLQPFLYYKGFLALQAHRIAHALWQGRRIDIASFIQMRSSEHFGVDIHPAARIGQGLMMDHAHGIVIGETAEIGTDVTLLHAVTLGGTGKMAGDRHPKIGDRVVIGAGATVLGNITVGTNARVAAGSVVLRSVPPGATVAGVPARIVGAEIPGLVDGGGI